MPPKKTYLTFIEEANSIHINKETELPLYCYIKNIEYNYNGIEYKNCKTKVSILCYKHGIFEITPDNHINLKQGCKDCGLDSRIKKRTYTTERFIEIAKKTHKDKNDIPLYDYKLVQYEKSDKEVSIICKIHNKVFKQIPAKHIQTNNPHGCPDCGILSSANSKRYSRNKFIELAKKQHINCNYDSVDYFDSITKVTIKCIIHDIYFKQTPANHLYGYGCRECGIEEMKHKQRMPKHIFIERSKKIYGTKYDYSNIDYKNTNTKIKIKCIKHNFEFEQTPYSHFNHEGCKKCSKSSYSNISIQWLDFISLYYNIHIRHASNHSQGEFKICDIKRYKADGFCEKTNTIYEFHGTIFHGDPRFCNPSECNYLGKNYGELYKNTIERENYIKNKGYNLIVIWEEDWKRACKIIKKIQQNFKYKKMLGTKNG